MDFLSSPIINHFQGGWLLYLKRKSLDGCNLPFDYSQVLPWERLILPASDIRDNIQQTTWVIWLIHPEGNSEMGGISMKDLLFIIQVNDFNFLFRCSFPVNLELILSLVRYNGDWFTQVKLEGDTRKPMCKSETHSMRLSIFNRRKFYFVLLHMHML